MLLLLTAAWHDALDAGRPFLVLAFDIAGVFDRCQALNSLSHP